MLGDSVVSQVNLETMDRIVEVPSKERRQRMLAMTIVALVVSGAIYGLLPESIRMITRLSLSAQAGAICVLAAGMTPLGAGLFRREQQGAVPHLLAGLAALFIGRMADVLYRWKLDWPGIWYFLGLSILIWGMFRLERTQ